MRERSSVSNRHLEQTEDGLRIEGPVEPRIRAIQLEDGQPLTESVQQLVIRCNVHHSQRLPGQFWHTEQQLQRLVTERAMIGAVKD